jgi:hypothetical protein
MHVGVEKIDIDKVAMNFTKNPRKRENFRIKIPARGKILYICQKIIGNESIISEF